MATTKKSAVAEEKAKTVVIQLPVIEGMGDSVYVSVNMKSYQIKRGETCRSAIMRGRSAGKLQQADYGSA